MWNSNREIDRDNLNSLFESDDRDAILIKAWLIVLALVGVVVSIEYALRGGVYG